MHKVFKLMSEDKIDEALNLIEKIELSSNICSNLLVAKGRCIMLSEQERYELQDAESCFQQAMHLDHENLEALIELAYYHFAVVDDPCMAQGYFSDAINKLRVLFTDSILGKAKCISENSSNHEAIKFLQDNDFIDMELINAFVQELVVD